LIFAKNNIFESFDQKFLTKIGIFKQLFDFPAKKTNFNEILNFHQFM